MKNTNRNQQQNEARHRKNQWNDIDQADKIFQRDLYKPYINSSSSQQTPQKYLTRQNLAQPDHNKQSQCQINIFNVTKLTH